MVNGTKEEEVVALFDKAMADDADGAPADLLVFNMGNNAAVDFREMTAQHFEDSWRVGCFAGFLFGREAMRRLAPLGRGTVIFTGASGSLRGRPRFAAFNATKGGLRLMVQSMAREFGPQGIHVAHAIIDGGIEGERLLSRMPDRAEKAGPDGCSTSTPSPTATGTSTASIAAPGRTRSTCGPTRSRSDDQGMASSSAVTRSGAEMMQLWPASIGRYRTCGIVWTFSCMPADTG